MVIFFFFNDTATTEIYTLSLHDALPIFAVGLDEFYRFFGVLSGDGGIALHAIFNGGEVAQIGRAHV